MADPLSVTASVIAVAGAAIQLAKTIYDFTDKMRNAPREMRRVGADMTNLAGIMDEIAKVLAKGAKIYRQDLIDRVNAILGMFEDVRVEVMRLISKKADTKSQRIRNRLMWPLKVNGLAELLSNVEALKSSTQLVLHVITLAITHDDPEKEKRLLFLIAFAIKENIQSIQDIQESQRHRSMPHPALEPYGPPPQLHALKPYVADHLTSNPFSPSGANPFLPNGVIGPDSNPSNPVQNTGASGTNNITATKRSRSSGRDFSAEVFRPTVSHSKSDPGQHRGRSPNRSSSLPRKPQEESVALTVKSGLGHAPEPPNDAAALFFRLIFEPQIEIGGDKNSGENMKTNPQKTDRKFSPGEKLGLDHTDDSASQQLQLSSHVPLAPPAIISEQLRRIEIPSVISNLLSQWTNLGQEQIGLIASKSKDEDDKAQNDTVGDDSDTDGESSNSESSWERIRDKYVSKEPKGGGEAGPSLVNKGVTGNTKEAPATEATEAEAAQRTRVIDRLDRVEDLLLKQFEFAQEYRKLKLLLKEKDAAEASAAKAKATEENAARAKRDQALEETLEEAAKDAERARNEANEAQAGAEADKARSAEFQRVEIEKIRAVNEAKVAAAREAKAAAAREAEERAAIANVQHQMVVDRIQKKLEDVQVEKQNLEEDAKGYKLITDRLIGPIRLNDVIGRKLIIPWQFCRTWKGMEEIIRQAFVHVDVIGEHVDLGHYDLVGPEKDILLPQLWEFTVKPNWTITMHMWPMPEEPKGPLPPGILPPLPPGAIPPSPPGVLPLGLPVALPPLQPPSSYDPLPPGLVLPIKQKKEATFSAPPPPPPPVQIAGLRGDSKTETKQERGSIGIPPPPGFPGFPTLPSVQIMPPPPGKSHRRSRREKGFSNRNSSTPTAKNSSDAESDEELKTEVTDITLRPVLPGVSFVSATVISSDETHFPTDLAGLVEEALGIEGKIVGITYRPMGNDGTWLCTGFLHLCGGEAEEDCVDDASSEMTEV